MPLLPDETAHDAARIRLIARSDEARAALDALEIEIDRFPCNVGRENRSSTKLRVSVEHRMGVVTPLNHVYLHQAGEGRYISREHFRISVVRGLFVLTDRASALGTTVNGRTIGGRRRGGHIDLQDGDQIAIGDAGSPIVFEFRMDRRRRG